MNTRKLMVIALLSTLLTATGLEITIQHSPDVDISLYVNGKLINGSGVSEYHESEWMKFDNETIWTWVNDSIRRNSTNETSF
jgi:hypothetical protein